MAATTNIRLTKTEQEEIRKKGIEFNKTLIAEGFQPLKDSELIHKILEEALPRLKIDRGGKIAID